MQGILRHIVGWVVQYTWLRWHHVGQHAGRGDDQISRNIVTTENWWWDDDSMMSIAKCWKSTSNKPECQKNWMKTQKSQLSTKADANGKYVSLLKMKKMWAGLKVKTKQFEKKIFKLRKNQDMNKTKWCNGFYIQFRQSFAKETFSYDEHLKS